MASLQEFHSLCFLILKCYRIFMNDYMMKMTHNRNNKDWELCRNTIKKLTMAMSLIQIDELT